MTRAKRSKRSNKKQAKRVSLSSRVRELCVRVRKCSKACMSYVINSGAVISIVANPCQWSFKPKVRVRANVHEYPFDNRRDVSVSFLFLDAHLFLDDGSIW